MSVSKRRYEHVPELGCLSVQHLESKDIQKCSSFVLRNTKGDCPHIGICKMVDVEVAIAESIIDNCIIRGSIP